jgi:4a-hydroxytetrahydrobiopterin dehydratase
MKEILKDKKCAALDAGTPPLGEQEVEEMLKQLPPGWIVLENIKIKKGFKCENFSKGVDFARKIALVADQEDHHPELYISYPMVEVEIYTHSIGGLSVNDFILAAKIEEI